MILFEGALTVANCLLVLITFMLWKATSEMACATRQLARIAESNRQLQHQPALVITRVSRDTTSSVFRIIVKNVGHGRASWVQVQVGDSNWHAPDRVFASRVSPVARVLEAGQEGEWSIPLKDTMLNNGELWIGVLYEGPILPPSAANFGTWGSVSLYSDTFAVEEGNNTGCVELKPVDRRRRE